VVEVESHLFLLMNGCVAGNCLVKSLFGRGPTSGYHSEDPKIEVVFDVLEV